MRAAGGGSHPGAGEFVRRNQQGRTMLQHWLIDLIGHVSGLSDAQLRQIETSLPATKALIDLLNRAQPMIEQAQSLYAEAEPLIDEAKKEWQTVGPAAQILIDVIPHHVDKDRPPAEAAEAVRAALDGSIKSVAQDREMDRDVSRVTVFGGTGFVGRRIARHLRGCGATVRIASRHPRRAEGDGLEQIAADAHDERAVEAAVAAADGVVNAISLYVEHGADTFHSVHVEAAARIARAARRAGTKRFVHLSGIGGDGRTRLQPAYADDVAAAIAQIVRQSKKPSPLYELAGPRVYSYEELLRTIARIAGLRPVLMRMPFAFWNALAGVGEMLPRPPLTRNQVELMQIDTTASERLPGFRTLGILPRSLEDELEAILRQNKPRVRLR